MSAPAANRRRTAAAYASRDLAVLRYVDRYGVGLNALLGERFFGGKEAGHVMRRLEAKGWVELHSAEIPGGVSYVTLTVAGGREVGRDVQPKRLGAVALDTAIAVAWRCAFPAVEGVSRRLTPAEVKRLGARLAANAPHLLTTDGLRKDGLTTGKGGRNRVMRVQLAASGKPSAVKDRADGFFRKAKLDARLSSWVESGDLGLVVLGHTAQRVAQLQGVFAGDERFAGCRLVVALGPTSGTVAACLRERRAT